jgi:hypothetical protein
VQINESSKHLVNGFYRTSAVEEDHIACLWVVKIINKFMYLIHTKRNYCNGQWNIHDVVYSFYTLYRDTPSYKFSSLTPDPISDIFRASCLSILWFVFSTGLMRLITVRYLFHYYGRISLNKICCLRLDAAFCKMLNTYNKFKTFAVSHFLLYLMQNHIY